MPNFSNVGEVAQWLKCLPYSQVNQCLNPYNYINARWAWQFTCKFSLRRWTWNHWAGWLVRLARTASSGSTGETASEDRVEKWQRRIPNITLQSSVWIGPHVDMHTCTSSADPAGIVPWLDCFHLIIQGFRLFMRQNINMQPDSASLVLGSKVCTTMPSMFLLFSWLVCILFCFVFCAADMSCTGWCVSVFLAPVKWRRRIRVHLRYIARSSSDT